MTLTIIRRDSLDTNLYQAEKTAVLVCIKLKVLTQNHRRQSPTSIITYREISSCFLVWTQNNWEFILKNLNTVNKDSLLILILFKEFASLGMVAHNPNLSSSKAEKGELL